MIRSVCFTALLLVSAADVSDLSRSSFEVPLRRGLVLPPHISKPMPTTTIRGARTWTSAKVPAAAMSSALKSVSFDADALAHAVYVAGEGGVVAKAPVDGGGKPLVFTTVKNAGFPSYYYGVVARHEKVLVTGFEDGAAGQLGIALSSADGGKTWSESTTVDNTTWLGGPIRCVGHNGSRCIVPSATSTSIYTTDAGLVAAGPWTKVIAGNGWHAGAFVANDATVRIVGVQDCTSKDRGSSFTCVDAIDSVFDNGIAIDEASGIGLSGGGSISPTLSGWVHTSSDRGQTWATKRALTAPFPVRFVGVYNDVRVAAGGDFNSGVGGIYTSKDGVKWTLEVDAGVEISECDGTVLSVDVKEGEESKSVLVVCAGSSHSGSKIFSALFN